MCQYIFSDVQLHLFLYQNHKWYGINFDFIIRLIGLRRKDAPAKIRERREVYRLFSIWTRWRNSIRYSHQKP